MNAVLARVLRRLLGYRPFRDLFRHNPRWLKFYPPVLPTTAQLAPNSRWPDYQTWLQRHALTTLADWRRRRQQDLSLTAPGLITLVTPVFNTPEEILYQCVLSVRLQTYPFWQWLLVDDGSSRPETKALLASPVCQDPRIQVLYQANQGIAAASNRGLAEARGAYVAFLDHDDTLAPDALSQLARALAADPDLDLVYSDRDMIAPEGFLYQHLFKPGWSPETLLSGNYAFHLLVYRRELLLELGGFRSEFDGSQDYDLLLRAAETNPKVRHIAAVLYHWRQHETSVAHSDTAKSYAFEAGTRALNEALARRGLAAKAYEIKDLWRGMQAIQWRPLSENEITVCRLDPADAAGYRAALAFDDLETPYLAILATTLTELADGALAGLCAWLTVPGVGLASGKLLDAQGKIEYAGMVYQNGWPIIPYRGYPESESGYLAMTRIVHNISAPHPYCVVLRRELWRQLGGLKPDYRGPYALLDLALRAQAAGWRSLVDPQYRWQTSAPLAIAAGEDRALFEQDWYRVLAEGDRYGNPHWQITDSGVRLNLNS